ncbi:hypothetical protein BOX15_Mlig033124g3, partial [Macrostomum lignano]
PLAASPDRARRYSNSSSSSSGSNSSTRAALLPSRLQTREPPQPAAAAAASATAQSAAPSLTESAEIPEEAGHSSAAVTEPPAADMRLSSACRPACCCCGLGRRARHRLAGGADFVRRHLAFALAPAACLLAVESGGLVAFAVLLLGALLGLLSLEAYLVYCRNEPPESRYFVDHPSRYGLPSQTVFLDSGRGARLHCYFIKQPGDSTRLPTLLFLHGNAGNIGHRLPNAALLFHQCRVNLFLLEYRGYGISTGAPSETGLYADAAAALQHLSRRSDIDPQRVLLFGRSLGGAVAIELAARPETAALLSGLVLENTFTSLPEAASVLFRLPLLSSLPGLVMTNRFNSRAKMPSVRVPTLFISGLRDTLIPPAMSACLHSLCGSGVRRLETFESGEHNTTWQCAGYFQRLAGFLHFASEMAPQREDWHAGQHSEDEEDQSAGAAAAAASATSAAGGASAGTAADDIPTITVL